MASDDQDLENFDDFDDFEFPEFDDAGLESGDRGRRPAEDLGKGFLSGVKNKMSDPRTIQKSIDRSMPRGYGRAFEAVTDTKDAVEDLYDEAKEQLAPAKASAKKIGRTVADKTEGYLPEVVTKKLRELSQAEDTDTESRRLSKEQAREMEVESRLAAIFGAQEEAESERDKEQHQESLRKEALENARHRSQQEHLSLIRSGMDRLVSYQDSVASRYQRRSLELQIKHLHVARDSFEILEAYSKDTYNQLDAISHNTSLPEFVKLQTSEFARQQIRSQMFGNISEKVGDFKDNMLPNLMERIKGGVRSGAGQLSEGIQTAVDIGEQTSEMGGSGPEMAGEMAGESAGDALLSRIGQFIGQRIPEEGRVRRWGENLEFATDNAGENFRDFIERESSRDDTSFVRQMLAETVRDQLPRFSATETMGKTATELAEETAPYTSLADKSITEVIPGLLTDILNETEMIRTGDETVERRQFDVEKGRTVRESELNKDIRERIMPERNRENIRDDLSEVVDQIDPDHNLSEKARMALSRQLLTDLSQGRGFNPTRLFTPRGLGEVEDDETRREIRDAVKARYLTEDGEFRTGDTQASMSRRRAAQSFSRAADEVPGYNESIKRLMPVYGSERLQQAGLIEEDEYSPGRYKTRQQSLEEMILNGQSETVSGQSQAQSRQAGSAFGDDDGHDDELGSSVDPGGLDRVAGLLERLVDVQQADDTRVRFEQLLEGIREIDTREHIDQSNDWLKKIYDLLLGSLGGGPGGGGPSGGGPPRNPWNDDIAAAYRDAEEKVGQFGTRLMGAMRTGAISASERARGAGESLKERISAHNTQRPDVSERVNQFKSAGVSHIENARAKFHGMDVASRYEDLKSQAGGYLKAAGDGISHYGEEARSRFEPFTSRMSQPGAANDPRKPSDEQMEELRRRRDGDGGSGGGDGSGNDDYWNKARELLHDLMDHMDEKTMELSDVIEQSSMMNAATDSPGMMKKIMSGAGSGIGGTLKYWGKSFSGLGSIFKGGGQLAGGAMGGLGKKMLGMGGKKDDDGIKDVYIKGRPQPVMLARDLRRGAYFDQQSGEVIETLSDIEGPVINEEGNVVISQADIDMDRLTTRGGEGLMSKLGNVAKGYWNYSTAPTRMLANAVLKAGQMVKDKLSGPRDIYVIGETQPRLLAVVMSNGGYLSQATGKIIMSKKDIDGAVTDRQGNVVLTHADIQKGLIDSRGKRIRSLGNLVKRGGQAIGRGVKRGISAVGRGLGKAKDMAMGTGSDEEGGEKSGLFRSNKKQVTVLQEIRDILDERMEKPDKIRTGSWRDQFSSDEDGKGGKVRNGEEDDGGRRYDGDGLLGMLGTGAGGLAGLLGDALGMGGETAAGAAAGNALGKRKGRKQAGGGKRNPKGKKGLLGKLWQGTKKWGGKALRGAGKAAKWGGSLLTSNAVRGALWWAGKRAVQGVALAGLTTAGVLTAPVAAAIGIGLTVAAVGWAAYSYFSGDDMGHLGRVRMAQYGVKHTDEKAVSGMVALEKLLEEDVVVSDGQARLGGNVEWEDILEEMGIDPENDKAVKQFSDWFKNRFQPVFLRHAAAAHKLADGATLTAVDEELEDKTKLQFLSSVSMDDLKRDPTSYVEPPYPDMEPLMGSGKVQKVIDEAKKAFSKDTGADKEGGSSSSAKSLRQQATEQSRESVSDPADKRRNPRKAQASPKLNVQPVNAQTRSGGSLTPRGTPGETWSSEETSLKADGKIKEDQGESGGSRSPRLGNVQTVSSNKDEDGEQEVVKLRRQRERVAQQTSIQGTEATKSMARSMTDVVSVLRNSYQVQRNMEDSLKDIYDQLRTNNGIDQDDIEAEREKRQQESNSWTDMFGSSSGTERSPDAPVRMR